MADAPDWATAPDWAKDDAPSWASEAKAKPGVVEKMLEPLTSYPETYQKMQKDARQEIGHGVDQITNSKGAWDVAKGAGNVALGTLGYVASPINAGLRTIAGKPVQDVTGIPKEYTEFATGLALPGIGLTRFPKGGPPALPPRPSSAAGVTLTEGEASGKLPLIQREQAALRGEQLGSGSHEHANRFAEQRTGQLEQAHEAVTRGMDPYGAVLAENPQEAGRLASDALRSAASQRKAGVTAAYDYAKGLPGEINAGAFEGVGPQIKNRLSLRDEPIIIDDLTPRAKKALEYIEQKVAAINIPNKAELSPFNAGAAMRSGEDVGVSLKGIDQWRKNLSQMRSDAFSSGNAPDGRAVRAVLDAFDDHVEQAVRNGAFRGDPHAVQSWLDARAAHADYKSTFGKQGGRDPVGNVVQKVLGDRINDPAIPSDVANHLYGASGVNPNSLNVGVAKRFKEVLGEQSPEWIAVKQGLWSRLTESAAGFGTKRTADRIEGFLSNREMANAVYTPWQQDLMREYAGMMRTITVPQAGANWSNTASGAVFQKISGVIGMTVGGLMGHAAGAKMGLPFPVGEAVGAAAAKLPKKLDDAREARRIANQMPILADRFNAWSKAVGKAQQAPTPMSERILRTTALNLDQTLNKLGTSLEGLQMPATVRGDDQQQIPGPPAQHHNGGQVGDRQRFAQGGRVQELSKVNRSYDVPYLAGPSKDGGTIYIDRRVPRQIKIGNKMLDPAIPLRIHERTEQRLMITRKMPYEDAHKIATTKERQWIESHGYSWKEYEAVMDGFLSHIEHEHPKKPPKDLFLKPYPHDKQLLLERAAKAE